MRPAQNPAYRVRSCWGWFRENEVRKMRVKMHREKREKAADHVTFGRKALRKWLRRMNHEREWR